MRRILFGLLCCWLMTPAHAISNEAARINGVTSFLIERANETYFYIFEKKMREHPLLPCYFPETFSYVNEGELKALLRSRDIWQEAMDRDFETLLIRTITRVVSDTIRLDDIALQATNEYAELVQFLQIRINGQLHPLDSIALDLRVEDRQVINGFYDEFNRARDMLLQLNAELQPYRDVCSSERPTRELMKEKLARLVATGEHLGRWVDHIQAHKARLSVDLNKLEDECRQQPALRICATRSEVIKVSNTIQSSLEIPVGRVVAFAALAKRQIENIESRQSYAAKVIEAFRAISDQGLDSRLEEKVQLKKLRTYLLFVAQIADSESADEVAGILKEYTLPTTSFLAKREPDEEHLLISAYFSYAVGQVLNEDDMAAQNRGGFYVPIGLEYSRGTNASGSWSIMLSPFDFGYPVSLKMNGVEADLALEDVWAPSLSIAYGIRDYPLNLGIAYQIGRTDRVSGAEEKRVLLFIGFDMPLFSLY